MAAIIRSEIVGDQIQADGRRYITEEYQDDQGEVERIEYLADADVDAAAVMATRGARLLAIKADREVDFNIAAILSLGSLAQPTLRYSTATQNIAALRAAYRISAGAAGVMIGDYLNTLTDTQLRNAFSMTAAQVTALRTNKLAPAATTAAQVRAAIGE